METGISHVKNQEGMSLVEVLIAIALLVLVGSAMVQLGVVALTTSDASRVRSIALQFADESIEIARNVRDTDPTAFFALTSMVQGKKYFSLSQNLPSTFTSTTNCNPVSNPPVVHADCTLSGIEVGSGTTDFYRIISVEPLSNDRFEVTAYVLWNNKGALSNVSTGTVLTRWK